eukprot:gene840-1047_t
MDNNNMDSVIESEPEFYKNFSEKILKDRKVKDGEILFFSLAGSHSFNLNIETSDKDYFGVFIGDIDDVLSLTPPISMLDCHDPDYVMFEVSKFCELILKGNPKLVEPLFSTKYCYKSSQWLNVLYENRMKFITESVIYHYISYSKTQLEIKRMLNGEEPLVFLTGETRQHIMDIRMGRCKTDDVLSEIDALYKEIQDRLDRMKSENKSLPNPPIQLLSDWLVGVRRNSINNSNMVVKFNEIDLELSFNGEEPKIVSECKELLNRNLKNAKLLFIIRSGSNSHNLNNHGSNSSSDDWIGVYAASTDSILSLFQPPSRIDKDFIPTTTTNENMNNNAQRDTYLNGIQLFEVSYFLTMVSMGNHRAVECFYNYKNVEYYSCNAWNQLLSLNINYLTSNFIHHCWGVAQGQLAKAKNIKDEKEIKKHLYHAFRLLDLSESAIDKSMINVYINDNEKRERLLSIKEQSSTNDYEKLIEECSIKIKLVNDKISKLNTNAKEKKSNESNLRLLLKDWIVKLRKSN